MGDFFRSTKFKILVTILCALVVLMFVTAYLGGRASPVSQALGVVTAPLQKLSSAISGAASGFFEKYLNSEQLYEENLALHEEIRTLREQLVEYEAYKRENALYQEVLGLKEKNPAWELASAEVIGRDPNDRFYGFTIDKGTFSDIAVRDPVITADGLVGWISEVGLNYAKVTTILDVSIDVGAVDTRTRDSGVVTGDVTLAEKGWCKLGYLTRDSAVTPGDIVETSGLGSVFGTLFPKGLIIGTINEVRAEPNGIVLYGVLEPAAQVTSVKDVFVITSFPGQSSELPSEGEADDSSSASDGASSAAQGAGGTSSNAQSGDGSSPAEQGGDKTSTAASSASSGEEAPPDNPGDSSQESSSLEGGAAGG